MAARKKVTKKVSKAATKSNVVRPARKASRASGSTVKAKRNAPGEKLQSSPKISSAAAKKSDVAEAVKLKPTAAKAARAETKPAPAETDKRAPAEAVKESKKPAAPAKSAVSTKERPKSADSKEINGRNAKRAEPVAPASDSPVVAGDSGTKPSMATVVAAKPAVTAAAATAVPQGAAKTIRTSAPPRPNERDSGGEQKTMKNNSNRYGFKLNEFVVYPAHGVGQIVAVEEQEVAGFKLELFVINFVKDKMTLRVPTSKVAGVGMRKLSDPEAARRSLEILTGRARVKRTMWSRRAQEYEAKINSGDINAIAEVVRDLYRSEAQPEQSYSERQLYEAALDRMMREIAAVQKLSETEALKVIDVQLKKNQKRGVTKGDGEAGEGEEAGIEEAA
jgi:CarD family transcriptional regulator